MYGRFEESTRRLKHWSTTPFTVPLAADEVDREFPAATTLPSYTQEDGALSTAVPAMVRATEDWTALQVDPELVFEWLKKKPDWDTQLPDAIGYFIVPAISFIQAFATGNGEAEVLRLHLSSGIVASAQCRGLLFFSFRNWTPPPIEAGVSGFDQRAKRQIQRLEVLNAHLACLHSALRASQNIAIAKLEIAPSNVIIRAGDDFDQPAGMGGEVLHSVWWHDKLPGRAVTVSEAALRASLETLDFILSRQADTLELVALLNRAATYYEEHNYAQAIVAAWTIAERLIRRTWTTYVENQQRDEIVNSLKKPFINRERRKRLVGADFTASVLTEFLSLHGTLPFDLYAQLNQARAARNSWLHEGRTPSRSAAEAAIATAQGTIAHFTGIRLNIPLMSVLTY